MAKTAIKQHEKVTKQDSCKKCGKVIKNVRVIGRGKTKVAKMCDCGVFIGNEKIQ